MHVPRFPCLFVALVLSSPVSAQSLTLEDLARRVAALERENSALRSEVRQLRSSVAMVPQAPPPQVQSARDPTSEMPSPDRSSWRGAYFGLSAGLQTDKYEFSDDAAPPFHSEARDWAAGLQVGHRWQSGPVVIGTEIGLHLPFSKRERLDADEISWFEIRSQHSAMIKGQLGLAQGPFLIYGTAGIESGNMKVRTMASGVDSTHREGLNATGFLLGLGGGYRFGSDTSVELEYTRTRFGQLQANTFIRDGSIVTFRINQGL